MFHCFPKGHAALAGHALLHPEKKRIIRVALVQERRPTQYQSHRLTEISAARADRNVVDENVCIVIPQMHTLDVTLAALAHTGCCATTLHSHCVCRVGRQVYGAGTPFTDTHTCTRRSSSKYRGIPGWTAALTWPAGGRFL